MKFKEISLKIKYFFSSSWGHIFITVILTVAILLLIFLPIVLAGLGKAEAIYVYGFDANITGTGEKFDDYIGVPKDYNHWNEDLVWAQNEEQMLNGVEQSKNSVGYLGKSVSSFEIYDPETNPSGELTPLDLYVLDSDGNNTPGYVDYNSDYYPMFSTLNIFFRVPASVAPILNNNIMFSNTTGIDIDNTIWGTNWIEGSPSRTLTEEQEDYFNNYVINPGYLKYFVFSFIFFNWITFSEDAQLIINSIAKYYQPYDNPFLLSSEEFEGYLLNFANNLESVNPNWTIDNFVNNNSNGKEVNLILTIEGTGTDQPTLDALTNGNAEYNGFNYYFSTWLQDYYNDPEWTFELNLTLNNHGSGQAFALVSNNANPNSFLGTQSRGYGISDITREEKNSNGQTLTWGYDQVTEDDIDPIGLYYLPDVETNDSTIEPLYYTFATDPILVYTGKDTSFTVDGINYHPTGISASALKYIYSFDGRSWEWLYLSSSEEIPLLTAEEI